MVWSKLPYGPYAAYAITNEISYEYGCSLALNKKSFNIVLL